MRINWFPKKQTWSAKLFPRLLLVDDFFCKISNSNISGLQCQPNSVFRLDSYRNFGELQWNFRFIANFKAKVEQQIEENRFQLHQRKSWADAVARSNAERQISVRVDTAAVALVEAIGIEFFGVRKVFRIAMEVPNRNEACDVTIDV